ETACIASAVFFFSSRRRHTRFSRDWSSDVCSSDLKRDIKSIAGLKGKTIIVGGAKDITRIFVDRMLAPHGVKPGEFDYVFAGARSEERRVGKEGRSRWSWDA